MSIRKKAVIIVGIMLIFLIVIFYSVTETIFSNSFFQMERIDVEKNVTRVKSGIDNEISSIDSINRAWSSWDETCKFISDHNNYFIQRNFNDEIFSSLKINFVIFVDKDQNIVFSKGYDFISGRSLKVPQSLLDDIINNDNINMKKGMQNSSGIINLPEGPIIVSSQPIIPSSLTGPIEGRLFVGRFLDKTFVDDISNDTGLIVEYKSFYDKNIDLDFKSAKQALLNDNKSIFIHPVSNDNIEGYACINDISGKPAIITRVLIPREIYMEGQTGREILIASTFGTSLLFCIIIFLLLEKKVLGPSRQREALINSIPSYIYFKDNELKYITANKAYCKKYNIAEKEIRDKTVFDIYEEKEAKKIYDEEIEVIDSGIPVLGRIEKSFENDGREKWYSISKTPYFDGNGRVRGMVGITTDITETKEMRDKLQYLAYYDQLTRLPNKTYFSELLDNTLAQAKAKCSNVGVLFIDLDQFKLINDTLGHDTGDTFLSDVAKRFKQCMDEKSIISRFGGDEFAVFVPDIKDTSNMEKLSESLLKLTSRPWEYGGQKFYITTSIGIAMYPRDGVNSEELLRNADAAMYYAKKHGKDSFKFYDERLSERTFEKIQLKKDLINALENGEFELYYQPQVNARSGKVIGVEALIRWNKPGVGIIYPDKFIHFAESSGLIISIGEAVLRMACRQVVKWQEAGFHPVKVAVNVSTKQFENQNFAETVEKILDETGMSAKLLEIEITETDMMKHPENAISILKTIRSMGASISVDDFGTGYSSLMYLKRLPIDRIKIDKSFVQDITEESGNTAIIKTIIDLSKNMGLNFIAEGVETQEQLEFLKEQKCDEVQGYIYSKPLPVSQVEKWLKA